MANPYANGGSELAGARGVGLDRAPSAAAAAAAAASAVSGEVLAASAPAWRLAEDFKEKGNQVRLTSPPRRIPPVVSPPPPQPSPKSPLNHS